MANTAITGEASSAFQNIVDTVIDEGKEFSIFSMDKVHIAANSSLDFDGGVLKFSTKTAQYMYYVVQKEAGDTITLSGSLANNVSEGILYKPARPAPEEEGSE